MGVRSIALVNDIDWLGGQFSAEALVAIDENRGPQGYDQTTPFPRHGLFKEVIDRIESVNLEKHGRARPGNTRVITTCLPADAAQVFAKLVEPYVASGQLRVFSHYAPESVTVDGDPPTVRKVRFVSTKGDQSEPLEVSAKLTIDASDWGDVIRMSGAEYEFGPDLKSEYGEPLAPEQRKGYPLTDMNPITYCLVLRETDRTEPIPAPQNYDRRSYDAHRYPRDPLWLYESRRLIDHYNFADVASPDALLLCFPAFDYPLDVLPQSVCDALEATEPGASEKNIVEMSREQRQIVFADAKLFSLGFLHYLQTVIHEQMPDQAHSFRRFELTDEFGTPDRCPPKPYIRESLRLKAMTMVRQQDTTGFGGRSELFATVMPHDGVACWQFEYDFHPTKRVFLDEGRTAGPWTTGFREGRTWGPPYSGRCLFPARSLVPISFDGLLGAQKNLGYTSIVSSAVRLHDQSMAIGQAVGALAAVSLQEGVPAREVPMSRELMPLIWLGLGRGSPDAEPVMLWPFRDATPEHPSFEAIQQLAIRRMIPLDPREINFRPDEPADDEWRAAVLEATTRQLAAPLPGVPNDESLTRGQFAVRWWKRVQTLRLKPWERRESSDADQDGIPDLDDPLPFSVESTSWPGFGPDPGEDGLPDKSLLEHPAAQRFNFTGPGGEETPGFVNDIGEVFQIVRGYGWSRDLSRQFRRRGLLPEELRDSFRFTRTHDVWELSLPNGRYHVALCIGDSGHEQDGQNVTIEGAALLRGANTPSGAFSEAQATVDIADGRLTIEIGLPDSTTNTCLNWVVVSPEP